MNHGPTAGLGLKLSHYEDALAADAAGLWFEVHAENYMVDGGPRLAWLEAIAIDKPLSLHGVGLSLAGEGPPNAAHLGRFRALIDRFRPFLISEHLAWSTADGAYYPDLLPILRTQQALRRIADNVSRAQDALGRRLLIENPTHYLDLRGHDLDEADFLTELCRRAGCGLLLDVNNVHVSANNLGFDAARAIDAFPADLIGEVHLAGHAPDPVLGAALLVDTHAAPVAAPVWDLYARLIERIGPRPTLIERDDAVPAFADLMAERGRAHDLLAAAVRMGSPVHA